LAQETPSTKYQQFTSRRFSNFCPLRLKVRGSPAQLAV